jgi:hypothetical protein
MDTPSRTTTYLQRQAYVGSSNYFLYISAHPITTIWRRFAGCSSSHLDGLGAIHRGNSRTRRFSGRSHFATLPHKDGVFSHQAKPERVGNTFDGHGTKERERLMQVLAFDELSRFTTALFSAPIVLVFTRSFAYLLNSMRRSVDTPPFYFYVFFRKSAA